MTWTGIGVGAASLWGVVFGFAYVRRRFGEPARGYAIKAVIAWLVTMAIFLLMSVMER